MAGADRGVVIAGEELGAQVSHRREAGQGWILLQLGRRHPGPFDEEPGEQNTEENHVDDQVLITGLKTFRFHHVAAYEKAAQHDQRHQAGQVKHKGKA